MSGMTPVAEPLLDPASYMARVVAAGEGLVVTTSADGGLESVAADGINTTIFGASGAITSEVAVPNLADTYFQGVQFADDLIVMGSAEMWVALRPSGEIVAQDAGYPTPISTDRISVVTDMPVQPGVGSLTVENGGSDTWFRSVDLAAGKRWGQRIPRRPGRNGVWCKSADGLVGRRVAGHHRGWR